MVHPHVFRRYVPKYGGSVAVESQQIADLTRHIRDVRMFQNVMHIKPTLIVQRTAASVISTCVCVCGTVSLHEQLSIAQHLRIFSNLLTDISMIY